MPPPGGITPFRSGHYAGDADGCGRKGEHHHRSEGHEHHAHGENRLPVGHFVGDGHNHGVGTEESHRHSETEHVHEEHEAHGASEEHVPQNAREWSSRQSLSLESRFQRVALPSEQLRNMNQSAQNQGSQDSKGMYAKSQASSAQPQFMAGKQTSINQKLDTLDPTCFESPPPQQFAQQKTNARMHLQPLVQKQDLAREESRGESKRMQLRESQNRSPSEGKSNPICFTSLLSGKTASVFLQSLPQSLRMSLGMAQASEAYPATSLQSATLNVASFRALSAISPKAFASALEAMQQLFNRDALLTKNAILGVQAYAPFVQIGVSVTFPNMLQRVEKAWSQFSNLLFGNYMLKVPPEEFCPDLLVQELGLLFMNQMRQKKEKKEVLLKIKIKKKRLEESEGLLSVREKQSFHEPIPRHQYNAGENDFFGERGEFGVFSAQQSDQGKTDEDD